MNDPYIILVAVVCLLPLIVWLGFVAVTYVGFRLSARGLEKLNKKASERYDVGKQTLVVTYTDKTGSLAEGTITLVGNRSVLHGNYVCDTPVERVVKQHVKGCYERGFFRVVDDKGDYVEHVYTPCDRVVEVREAEREEYVVDGFGVKV